MHWITPELLFWASLGLLIYTWLGYPMLLFLAERIMYTPIRKGEYEPSVSILLVAHNEEERIAQKLDNLLAIDYPPEKLHITVASDGSHDNTCSVVQKYEPKGVRLLEYPMRRGKPSALNDAIPQLEGEIVVLVDTRQRLDSDVLRRLVANFADASVGGVSGELVFEEPDNAGIAQGIDAYWRYEKWLRNKEAGIHSTVGGTGALFALRKHLFSPIPPTTILDDVVLPLKIVRQGYRVALELGARAWDVAHSQWEREFSRKARTFSGNFQILANWGDMGPRPWGPLALQFLSHKALRLFNPLFLLVAFYLNWLLMQQEQLIYQITFWGQIGFYALAACGWMVQGKTVRLPLISLCYSFLLMQVAIVTGFLRYASGRDDVLWEKAQTLVPGTAQKRFWRLMFDSALFCLGFVAAFYLRYLDSPPPEAFRWLTVLTPSFTVFGVTLAVPLFMLIPLMVFYFFRLSESRAEEITPEYFLLLLKSVLYATFGVFLAMYVLRSSLLQVVQTGNQIRVVSLPTGVILIAVALNSLTISGWRFLFFLRRRARESSEKTKRHLLLIGPSGTDDSLCREITRSFGENASPACIVESSEKDGQTRFLRRTERFMIGRHAPDLAILDPRRLTRHSLLDLVAVADEEDLPVELLGGDFEILLGRTPPRLTNYIPLLDVDRRISTELSVFVKRMLDLGMGIVMLLPGFLCLGLLYLGRILLPGWRAVRVIRVQRHGINGKVVQQRRLLAPASVRPRCLVALARWGLRGLALIAGDLSLIGPPALTARQWQKRHPIAKRFMQFSPGLICLRRLAADAGELLNPCDRALIYYARNFSLGLDLEIFWLYLQSRPSSASRTPEENKETPS